MNNLHNKTWLLQFQRLLVKFGHRLNPSGWRKGAKTAKFSGLYSLRFGYLLWGTEFHTTWCNTVDHRTLCESSTTISKLLLLPIRSVQLSLLWPISRDEYPQATMWMYQYFLARELSQLSLVKGQRGSTLSFFLSHSTPSCSLRWWVCSPSASGRLRGWLFESLTSPQAQIQKIVPY